MGRWHGSCGFTRMGPAVPPITEPLVRIDALRKRYGGHEVLKGVDLELMRGEIVALVGPSGAGKSTLLRCLGGLEPFEEGELAAPDWPHHRDEDPTRRARLIFQGLNLHPQLSVGANVSLAHACYGKPCVAGHARERLARVGMAEAFDAMPAALSPGQHQRAVIARALVDEPELLLCDDIASSADPVLAGEVGLALRALAQGGQAVLIATSDAAFAGSLADRIVWLEDGRLREAERLTAARPRTGRRRPWPAPPETG